MSNNEPDYGENLVFPPQIDRLSIVKAALLNLRVLAEISINNGTAMDSKMVFDICNQVIKDMEKTNNV